jgi:ArsR family transcriptional regulator, arsenate/arsenite/antimonite-responsive transcriptional repressor
MNPEQLVRVFKALGNENRLKILETINSNQGQCECGPESVGTFDVKESAACCVDEIVGQFDMAQSTISQNLKELHSAGLLERHKKAQWVYYTINRKRLEDLAEYLRQFAFGPGP